MDDEITPMDWIVPHKITEKEIRNLVEYCLQGNEVKEKDTDELITRLKSEFNTQWKLSKEV